MPGERLCVSFLSFGSLKVTGVIPSDPETGLLGHSKGIIKCPTLVVQCVYIMCGAVQLHYILTNFCMVTSDLVTLPLLSHLKLKASCSRTRTMRGTLPSASVIVQQRWCKEWRYVNVSFWPGNWSITGYNLRVFVCTLMPGWLSSILVATSIRWCHSKQVGSLESPSWQWQTWPVKVQSPHL